MNETNIHPAGFLLMDTCCFSHYCRGSVRKEFNYLDIRKFINDNKYWAVITPYTLYEFVQNCTTPKVIEDVRDDIFRAGDFWVMNVNRLIGEEYAFEYGPDFLLEFGFDPSRPQEFINKLSIWRGKIYASLAPRITLLSQILAIIYVLINERDKDGFISMETAWKMQFIDEEFVNNDAITRLLDHFLHQHTKTDLIDFIEGLIKQMMAMANVYVEQKMTNKFNILAEYNARILEENDRLEGMYSRQEMSRKYKQERKASQGTFELNILVEGFLQHRETIFRGLFIRIVEKWFIEHYSGKDIANTIIDYVNFGILELKLSVPIIYITEEGAFAQMIQRLDEEYLYKTKEFYKRFYKVGN